MGIGDNSWIAAQLRVIVALSTAVEIPALSQGVRLVMGEPVVEETVVAGVETTRVRPSGRGPWPALVFVNGVTARGRHHPEVERFARGLGRAGYLVVVPDVPGLAQGELTDLTVGSTVAVASATADREDARRGRVGFFGVSLGTTLSLLAAGSPALAERVSVIAGLAPYTSLINAFRLATTDSYVESGRFLPYRPSELLALVVARSLAAALPDGPDRRLVCSALPAVADEVHEPLAGLRSISTADLASETRAVIELLLNRDPRRFDLLYAALPVRMRAGVERLSPLAWASRLRAPVELASAPHDKYFPLAESRALERAVPGARLTVTGALAHAELSIGHLGDLARLDAFGVRVLRRAAARSGSRTAGERREQSTGGDELRPDRESA